MSVLKRLGGQGLGDDSLGGDQFPPGIANSQADPGATATPNSHALSAPPFLGLAPDAGPGQPFPSDPALIGSSVASIGTTSTTSTLSTVLSPTGSSTISPFVINISWDASVASAPAGFTSGVIAAAQYLESQFTNAVTLNISVGYGEVGGYALGGNDLGESGTNLTSTTYSAILNGLKSDATSATDTSVLASLPATSPVNGTFYVTTSEAKVLGLTSPNATGVDGYIGLSSTIPFTYNDTNGVAGGTYDFNGTVLHEITELMGRALYDGYQYGTTNLYNLYDMLHYSAPGVRDFSVSTPGYFSPDGGVTNLGEFNTGSGDGGDWASSMGNDSFDAVANSGVINGISAGDLTVLDALGWNLAGSAPAPAPAPTPAPPPIATAPTGVSVAALATSLSNALAVASPIAKLNQVGGTTGHTFAYQLGGAGAGAFSLASSSNVGTLMSGAAGLAGSTNGTLYALTVTATDTTANVSSPTVPVDLIVGTIGTDTISAAALSANIGTSTPTFIFGREGSDTLSGAGMTGSLWFIGGGGADKMTGGSGANSYMYSATSDSAGSMVDVITNFNVGMDHIDLTGLSSALQVAGSINSNGKGANVNVLAAHSIGWQASGGNTFVYVNTSGSKEAVGGTNMKIELMGGVSLSSGNFLHA
jgi:hypothetical protein